MKYEWKKSEKALYGVKSTAVLVDVPQQAFITITGRGNPNDTDFSARVSALYSLAYAIKMLFKAMMKNEPDDKISDFVVYPLEAIWQKADMADGVLDKDSLQYTLMIRQPESITQVMFAKAMDNVKKKKPNTLYDEIRFEQMSDGKCVQVLHIGSYDDEPASFAKMQQLIDQMGLTRRDKTHKEIYLNNPDRTTADKLKTILRYTLRR